MPGRKAAIVTGAASGIGRAVAARLQQDGIDVLAVDLHADRSGTGTACEADLIRPEANAAVVSEARRRFGRIDVIVPCAGVQHIASVEEFPPERWEAMLALMLSSPFLLAKHAWPALRDSGAGRFIVIASAHALVASPYKAAYVAAKHGVLGLVKTLALEGAADAITATAVCPGYVRTPLVIGQLRAQAAARGMAEEDVLENVILEPHAIKALIEPEEVAEVVAFLAGHAGRSFTGVPMTMDLGWTAK